jgi:hypothetical protein
MSEITKIICADTHFAVDEDTQYAYCPGYRKQTHHGDFR